MNTEPTYSAEYWEDCHDDELLSWAADPSATTEDLTGVLAEVSGRLERLDDPDVRIPHLLAMDAASTLNDALMHCLRRLPEEAL